MRLVSESTENKVTNPDIRLLIRLITPNTEIQITRKEILEIRSQYFRNQNFSKKGLKAPVSPKTKNIFRKHFWEVHKL